MAEPLEVWGIRSARAMRVHWMLRELGVEYVAHPIGSRTGETQTAAYLALNPLGKIPALRRGDLVLTESAAIVNYLADSFPAPEGFFVPADAADRARQAEWCYFVMTELDAHSLYLIRRHDSLARIYGAAPEAVESARAYFTKQLNARRDRIAAADPWLLGGFGAADILLATCLDWVEAYGIALPAETVSYRARIARRPAWRDAMRFNYPDREFSVPGEAR